VRKGWVCLLVVGLVGLAFAAHGQTPTVSKTAVQRLDEFNQVLDELLGGLEGGTMGSEEVDAALERATASFEAVVAEMPAAGLLFNDVFTALYAVQRALDEAKEIVDSGMSLRPYSLRGAISDARWAADSLRWAASGGLIREQLTCPKGRALVMVYLGFDCHALRAKLNELLAAGKCVTVGWREPLCNIADPNVAFSGPTARQLFDCIMISRFAGPMLQWDALVGPDAPGFSEYHTFGNPEADCHASQAPGAPHPAYADSELALDVTGGEPVLPDPSRVFSAGDVLKPHYKVKDVCDPLAFDWRVYDPDGMLAYTDSGTLDPADFDTDCLSDFSSTGWMSLDPGSFGTAGTYIAELWLGGEHCANHNFTMAGPGNRAPYVNDDVYTMDEDLVLEVKEHGVFGNDLDPDADPLTATLVEAPQHGSLALDADGTFAYVPEADFYGVDWFTYEATDPSGLSATGEVAILVNPVNDVPTAGDDVFDIVISAAERTWTITVAALGWSQLGTFVEDGVFIDIPAPGVLINDSDPDGDPLSIVSDGLSTPVSLAVSGNGSLAIRIPDPGDVQGVFPMSYRAVDPAGLEATGEIEIRVSLQEGAD